MTFYPLKYSFFDGKKLLLIIWLYLFIQGCKLWINTITMRFCYSSRAGGSPSGARLWASVPETDNGSKWAGYIQSVRREGEGLGKGTEESEGCCWREAEDGQPEGLQDGKDSHHPHLSGSSNGDYSEFVSIVVFITFWFITNCDIKLLIDLTTSTGYILYKYNIEISVNNISSFWDKN